MRTRQKERERSKSEIIFKLLGDLGESRISVDQYESQRRKYGLTEEDIDRYIEEEL